MLYVQELPFTEFILLDEVERDIVELEAGYGTEKPYFLCKEICNQGHP